ncbi:MAG: hypothetical protein A2557_03540 [Candidatus Lambdaproteobacteria bacterium RIFOXYD2_FULL_56_26]|uniref:Uncharacterized protein n=1 Tax=Candidatus Lambdaproteobacteria bacterium RIFOXYD2_FULL_56_26 TaxID=1817773 RepID=A0A1F6GRA3_9PROT|nr:MAG: hypothetical protein A2557_03540 [Candidatus Lambdaproteobacteria bacterium RIFOXYD2_FULL_56_26]
MNKGFGAWKQVFRRWSKLTDRINYKLVWLARPKYMLPFSGFMGNISFADRLPYGSFWGMSIGMGLYWSMYLLQQNELYPFACRVHLPPVEPIRSARWYKWKGLD